MSTPPPSNFFCCADDLTTLGAARGPFADLSRRALVGSGLVAGLFLLTGCSRTAKTVLPGPKWPDDHGPVIIKPTPQAPNPVAGPVMNVVPRSQWTRSGVGRPGEINPMNGVSRITIHHDAVHSGDIRSSADAARRLESFRRDHVNSRRWADIGYHYIIDPSGRIWEGRNVRFQGAHVKDNNENNVGVMLMGNFNQQSPSPQQIASLDRFVGQQMTRYRVPMSRVYTHQELGQSACPGSSLQRYMSKTRRSGGSLAMGVATGRFS
ncbi:MAG: N-acetylmuramoyl-L-alanine amidase [Phycisphaerales bacterium]|nr:N-acetylmuramoyl-L-alanine amidase [Phycisphaerales bacterium]